VADAGNNCVRRISLRADVITRFAGSCQAFGDTGDGGPALKATLSIPFGVAVGRDGTVFIADTGNYRLREVTPGGTILTLAGTGQSGFYGDGVPARQAAFGAPTALAIDRKTGDLLVVDTLSQRVRALVLEMPVLEKGITAAAALFCVAIGVFATSSIVFIKELGVGTALAVVIDASVVRALLVPSLMALLGQWNWWAPRRLRQLHRRLHLDRLEVRPLAA